MFKSKYLHRPEGSLALHQSLLRMAALSLLALLIGFALTACGAPGSGKGAEEPIEEEAITIGFSLGTLAQRRWQFDKTYVEARAEELGLEIIVQAAEDSEQLQLSQVENMIAQGIDVLILSPINVEVAASAVEAAKEAGIPVVSYNSVVLNAPIDYWVARDNVLVGRIQAKMAVAAKPTGNYIILSGEPGVDIAQEKTAGNMEVLQPLIDSGDINLVSQQYHRGWDPALGLKQVEDALTSTDSQIDAILTNYDGFALAAMEALDEVGLLGETWIGGEDVFLEAAQAMVAGDMAMSAYTDLQEMAVTAVDAAYALAKGETPLSTDTIDNGYAEIPGQRISSFAVTADTMCEFIRDIGWLEFDEVYKDMPEEERPSC